MEGVAYSKIAPDAEFIGAGDDVVILDGSGGIAAGGVLVDAADPSKAEVRVPGETEWRVVPLALLAHPDSPQAEAVAMFGEQRRDPAVTMQVVHEEAKAQNGWDVYGVAFIGLDQETGIVRFRHAPGRFGTASFRWDPEAQLGDDRVGFNHGHYDLTFPTSARDFTERVLRAA